MANPFNFRVHSSYQQKVLEANIDHLGFIRSVTVNRQTGHVIDGHLRIILALRRDEPEIDVEYIDLLPEDEILALVTLDPIAALAGKDNTKLDETLRGLTVTNPTLTAFVGRLAGQAGLYQTPPDSDTGLSDNESKPTTPEPSDSDMPSSVSKPTRYYTLSLPFTSPERLQEGYHLLTLGRLTLEEDAAFAQLNPEQVGEDGTTLLDAWREIFSEVYDG